MFICNSCGQSITGHAFFYLLYTCYYFCVISQFSNVTKCFITAAIMKKVLENWYFILSETVILFPDSRGLLICFV